MNPLLQIRREPGKTRCRVLLLNMQGPARSVMLGHLDCPPALAEDLEAWAHAMGWPVEVEDVGPGGPRRRRSTA